MTACIGTPISWPRLERHALAADPAIARHLTQCPACQQCLEEITRDVVALPVLVVPAKKPARFRWWYALVPVLAAAAILVAIWPRQHAENITSIKGVGDVTLGVVRERRGAITEDATTFAPGDRWKLVITCAPGHETQITVDVTDATTIDHPLAPAELACGNRIVLPGAFELNGGANRVCAHVTSSGHTGTACVTLRPE
ncbi:MAG TPA: hypothetical protein VGC41_15035 [Kofleriaceae bacterium]